MTTPVEIKVPSENVNDDFARLVEWCVRPGQAVATGQVLCRLETTKAVFDVQSPGDGIVDYHHAAGADLRTGSTLCWLRAEAVSSATAGTAARSDDAAGATVTPPSAGPGARQPAGSTTVFSKKAEALLLQFSLDPAVFRGMPLVREDDVLKAARERGLTPPAADTAAAVSTTPSGSAATTGGDDAFSSLEPLERGKAWENRMLSAAERSALRSTLHFWCPAADFTRACTALVPASTRLAVVIHAVAACLHRHPRLNATLRDDRVGIYRDVNVGFAVDMGRGLKVLTIRQPHLATRETIGESIDDLMVKYATDSLLPSDVTGSTFTITDLGGDGVFAFVPLLNVGQSAILGLGSESTLAGMPGFMLSCSFDHRMLGGRQVAEFLGDLSESLVSLASAATHEVEEPCCARCLRSAADVRRVEGFLLSSAEPEGLICSICLGGA